MLSSFLSVGDSPATVTSATGFSGFGDRDLGDGEGSISISDDLSGALTGVVSDSLEFCLIGDGCTGLDAGENVGLIGRAGGTLETSGLGERGGGGRCRTFFTSSSSSAGITASFCSVRMRRASSSNQRASCCLARRSRFSASNLALVSAFSRKLL